MREETVFFDLETGGFDGSRHPLTQVAAVAVDSGWSELEHIELKVKFKEENADPQALALNKYDPDVWARDGLSPYVAERALSAFMKRHATVSKRSKRNGRAYRVARLAGHNASAFDGPFLAAWYKRLDSFCPGTCYEVLDTMSLARWVTCRLPPEDRPEDHKLETLCAWAGVPIAEGDAHDALADVRATVALAERLLAMAPVSASVVGMVRAGMGRG